MFNYFDVIQRNFFLVPEIFFFKNIYLHVYVCRCMYVCVLMFVRCILLWNPIYGNGLYSLQHLQYFITYNHHHHHQRLCVNQNIKTRIFLFLSFSIIFIRYAPAPNFIVCDCEHFLWKYFCQTSWRILFFHYYCYCPKGIFGCCCCCWSVDGL